MGCLAHGQALLREPSCAKALLRKAARGGWLRGPRPSPNRPTAQSRPITRTLDLRLAHLAVFLELRDVVLVLVEQMLDLLLVHLDLNLMTLLQLLHLPVLVAQLRLPVLQLLRTRSESEGGLGAGG